MKIAIIGAGNIGGATAMGLALSSKLNASDIWVTARHAERLERFQSKGLSTSTDNKKAAEGADILCIAVKPWQVEEVLTELKPAIEPQTLIVSIAPGVSAEALKNALPEGQRLAYVIPNTAMEIGQSMTYVSSVSATEDDITLLTELLSASGTVHVVPLDLMLMGTSLASCGIAYAMRFIEAAAKAGQELGLDPAKALESACQTAKGAAEILLAHKSLPADEIKKVTTPNGLTERGLKAMEEAGFSEAVAKGIKAVKR